MKVISRPLTSLQARLLALLLALVVAVWLGAALMTWFDTRDELDELLDGHLAQAAALLLVQQGAADDDDGLADAPSLHKYAPKVAFQVFHKGRLSMRSLNTASSPMSGSGTGFSTVVMADDTQWRVFSAQGNEGTTQVYVAEQIAARTSILWAVLRSVLWPLALSLPLLALAIWWAVRQGLGPLRRLSEALHQRKAQATEPLVLDDTPSELQALVSALNALFERIAGMVASERRFTADAAHELRTPIAAIRAQAQVALGAGNDVAQREHALQSTLAGCDRATRLVEQLLLLARLEDAPQDALARVNLSALSRQIVADLAPAAIKRRQTLELYAPDACLVDGNEALVAVLLRNLGDNALRYSPDGTKVQISVQALSEGVVLQVDDGGPGMTDTEIARLGERFFRVLGSGQVGSGLGWSIVKRISSGFGAQLQVGRSSTLGGLAVSVLWPRNH